MLLYLFNNFSVNMHNTNVNLLFWSNSTEHRDWIPQRVGYSHPSGLIAEKSNLKIIASCLFVCFWTVPHWEINMELIVRALRCMIQCTRHYCIYVCFNCLILAVASCLPLKAGGIQLSAFPKDTSELAGLVSTLSPLMLNTKQGSCECQFSKVYRFRGRRSIHYAIWSCWYFAVITSLWLITLASSHYLYFHIRWFYAIQ